jgi:hypothetical protein
MWCKSRGQGKQMIAGESGTEYAAVFDSIAFLLEVKLKRDQIHSKSRVIVGIPYSSS